MGTPNNGDALSVLSDKLQNASGKKVDFVTAYFPRRAKPDYVVACGPCTYADDIARGRVQLSILNHWKNSDNTIRVICGEADIVGLCQDSCSAAEQAALRGVLTAKGPPSSAHKAKRGGEDGAAGGGTGASPAKRHSTGGGAAAAATASPSLRSGDG